MGRTLSDMVMLGSLVLMMLVCSVLAEVGRHNEHQNRDLLKSFLDAKRRIKRSDADIDILDKKVSQYCMKRVMALTVDGTLEEQKGLKFIEDCLTECIVNAQAPGFFDIDVFEDHECVDDGPASRGLSDELNVTGRKWRPFKKIGAWFRKNKDKILKGLETAGRIIGGIIKAIGKG